MVYINFNLHTDLIPMKLYELNEVDLIVYPTKHKLSVLEGHISRTLTGVIIRGEESELTKGFIKKRIKEFVVFSNFIFPCYKSVKWLNAYSFHEVEKKLSPINGLQTFLQENIETDIGQIHGYLQTREIYDQCSVFPHANSLKLKINFQELFKIFYSLEDSNKLKQQISLFALNGSIISLLNPFYDNSNLEVSLMYSIIDSLIDEYDPDQSVIKECDKCGLKRTGRKGSEKRIKDFVSILGSNTKFKFSKEDQELIFRILWEHFKVRNEFFHETKLVPFGITEEKMIEITGSNSISLEDELKYGQARFFGYMIIKELVQNILIEKLTSLKLM